MSMTDYAVRSVTLQVHGFCGAWGVISVGLFATSGNMNNVYGSDKYGCLTGGDFTILGNQIAAVCLIFAWVFGTTYPFFMLLKKLGLLRVDLDTEIAGMDDSEHGGKTGKIIGRNRTTCTWFLGMCVAACSPLSLRSLHCQARTRVSPTWSRVSPFLSPLPRPPLPRPRSFGHGHLHFGYQTHALNTQFIHSLIGCVGEGYIVQIKNDL